MLYHRVHTNRVNVFCPAVVVFACRISVNHELDFSQSRVKTLSRVNLSIVRGRSSSSPLWLPRETKQHYGSSFSSQAYERTKESIGLTLDLYTLRKSINQQLPRVAAMEASTMETTNVNVTAAPDPDDGEYDLQDDQDDYPHLFQSVRSQTGLEIGVCVTWPGVGQALELSTCLPAEEIAPMFHGTQW